MFSFVLAILASTFFLIPASVISFHIAISTETLFLFLFVGLGFAFLSIYSKLEEIHRMLKDKNTEGDKKKKD